MQNNNRHKSKDSKTKSPTRPALGCQVASNTKSGPHPTGLFLVKSWKTQCPTREVSRRLRIAVTQSICEFKCGNSNANRVYVCSIGRFKGVYKLYFALCGLLIWGCIGDGYREYERWPISFKISIFESVFWKIDVKFNMRPISIKVIKLMLLGCIRSRIIVLTPMFMDGQSEIYC